MDTTVVFSLVLLAIAAGLILSQRRAMRAVLGSQRSVVERAHAVGQVQRRLQTGWLVGVLAIAIVAGDRIQSPIWALCFWCAVAMLVLWVLYLALADVSATRKYYGRLLHDHHMEKIRWQAETLRQAEEQRNATNGHDPAPHNLN